MDHFRIILALIFLVIIFVVGPKLAKYIQNKPDKRMGTDYFILSKTKGLSWMWASVFLFAMSLFFLLATQGDIADTWHIYLVVSIISLAIIVYLIRLNFYRIKVKDGHFHYRPVFRRSKKFQLSDIKKVERARCKDGVSTIVLYSEKEELVRVDSSLKGYVTFITFLKENELIS